MKKTIMLLMLIFSSIAQAIILESDDIRTVLHHVYDTHHHREILVLFDIDNTTGHVADGFGGDEMFNALFRQRINNGEPIYVALGELLKLYYVIHPTVWLEPVQPEIPKLISFLQDAGIAVVALTSRSEPIRAHTHKQLARMGIDFSLSTPCQEQVDMTFKEGDQFKAHLEHGVLFCAENDKGELLVHFFKSIKYAPKKVVFIDDKIKYCEQVDRAMKNAGIPSICIRYSKLDEKVKNFNLDDHKHRLKPFIKQVYEQNLATTAN